MGIVAYLKERFKPMLVGFLVGLAAGYGRCHYFAPADLPTSARWALILQIAFAVSALALFITNYLELRRRVIQKASESIAKED